MSRVDLVVTVRRARQMAAETRGRDVDVAIAEQLRQEGWIVDDADRAQQIEQKQIDEALARRQSESGCSASVCDECGEPIPQARRNAIPGVRLCVRCQEDAERG